jgi:hypothetical protein
MTLDRLGPQQKWVSEIFLGVKGGRRVRLTTWCLENVRVVTSHKPVCLHACYRQSFTCFCHIRVYKSIRMSYKSTSHLQKIRARMEYAAPRMRYLFHCISKDTCETYSVHTLSSERVTIDGVWTGGSLYCTLWYNAWLHFTVQYYTYTSVHKHVFISVTWQRLPTADILLPLDSATSATSF